MTRIKSITELAGLYESIYSGENVIEEKASGKKFPKNSFPKAGEEVKEPKTFKDSGPNKVKGFKKAKKNKKKGGKLHKENINSSMKSKFDKLFENVMDDELDVNLDLGPGAGPEDSSAEDLDLGAESETGSEDITLTLDRETAQKLHDMLGDVLGGGEELSGEEDSDLEDLEIDTEGESETEDEDAEEEDEQEEVEEEEEEDEESYKEAIESEKLPDSKGHSLTKAGTVGNIKASSKKASSDVTDEVGSSTLGDKSNVLQKPGTVGNLGKGQDFFKA